MLQVLKYLIFIILFSITQIFPVKAQEQTKAYIGGSIGGSIPGGDLADKILKNTSAGFAKGGIMIEASFALKLLKNFGLAANIRSLTFTTDAQAYANEFSKAVPYADINVTSGAISGSVFSGGGYISIPLTDRNNIFWDTKILAGVMAASIADITVTYIFDVQTQAYLELPASVTETASTVSSASFAYSLGTGLRINTGKSVLLLVNIDYLGANPEFSRTFKNNLYSDIQTENFKMDFNAVTIGAGIAFRFLNNKVAESLKD